MKKLNLSKIILFITLISAFALTMNSAFEAKAEDTVPVDSENQIKPAQKNDPASSAETSKKEQAPLTVDKEAYRRKIRSKLPELKKCYDEVLKDNKKAEGKVVIDFSVDDKGSVVTANMNTEKSTLTNESLKECLITKINELNFPMPPKGMTADISYPFYFSARKKSSVQVLTK